MKQEGNKLGRWLYFLEKRVEYLVLSLGINQFLLLYIEHRISRDVSYEYGSMHPHPGYIQMYLFTFDFELDMLFGTG